MAGQRVELVFDPFDLSRIEVRLNGSDKGVATPFQISRHSHPKARPETSAQEPPPHSGIDYLALLDAQHTRDAAGKVNYAALLGDQAPPSPDHGQPTPTPTAIATPTSSNVASVVTPDEHTDIVDELIDALHEHVVGFNSSA